MTGAQVQTKKSNRRIVEGIWKQQEIMSNLHTIDPFSFAFNDESLNANNFVATFLQNKIKNCNVLALPRVEWTWISASAILAKGQVERHTQLAIN